MDINIAYRCTREKSVVLYTFSFPGTWPMESRVRGSPETEPREQLPMLQEFFKQNVTRGRLIERIVKTSDVQSTNTNPKRKIYSYEYSVENKKQGMRQNLYFVTDGI